MSSLFAKDAEYERLHALYKQARADGNRDLENSYALATCRRGDELLAKQGLPCRFAPLLEAVHALESLAPGPDLA